MEPLLRSHTGPLKCSSVLCLSLVLEEQIGEREKVCVCVCVMEKLDKMEGNRGRVSRFLGGKGVGINVGKLRDCFTVCGGGWIDNGRKIIR